jgi:Glycosyltransferase sugar-binding region containing DXD motif
MTAVIQGLWVGKTLTAMERMSIALFLKHGHEYHLYVYDDVGPVPRGVVLKDAASILPASRIFQYHRHETYSGFANFFRYKLLQEHGGWWCDLDVICLKPFDFPSEHVFALERTAGQPRLGNGILRAPRGSTIMTLAWLACDRVKYPEDMAWGEMGPKLIAKLVGLLALEANVQDSQVFSPLECDQWETVLDPAAVLALAPETHAIHMWNEMWRRRKLDKDASYPADCLYERLKRAYLEP